MNKIILSLLLVGFLYHGFLIAQVLPSYPNYPISVIANQKSHKPSKPIQYSSKAFGDTLFYESFSNGIPTNWQVINNNSNNVIWKWDTVYQQGMFSQNTNRIMSPTGSTGFMSLPMDFYNTPLGLVQTADTYFESDTIFVSSARSVLFTYYQYLRYCCNLNNRLVLQISTNNFINYLEFDATDGVPVNIANTTNTIGGALNTIDISCALAGSPQFKFRILASGNSHYFWMIDDIAIIEGPDNDLVLQQSTIEFNQSYTTNPIYTKIPFNFMQTTGFSGVVKNAGANNATNSQLKVKVTNISASGGANPQGLIYSDSALIRNTGFIPGSPFSVCDSTYNVYLVNTNISYNNIGNYRADFEITSDSIDQLPLNNFNSHIFELTDTIYARDDDNFEASTGVGRYVDPSGNPGGTNVGDRYGTLFIIEPRFGNSVLNIPTSISFYISNDSSNLGLEIAPKIWTFDESAASITAAIGNSVASTFIPYTITAIDTLIPLRLDVGTATINGLDTGQYVVGFESTNNPNNRILSLYNDVSTMLIQKPATTFLSFGGSSNWGWVFDNPAIRLNFGRIITGIEQIEIDKLQFDIYSNPNNGVFYFAIQSKEAKPAEILIYNTNGQLVVNQKLQIKQGTMKFDFSEFNTGLYFIHLKTEKENLVRKVVVN